MIESGKTPFNPPARAIRTALAAASPPVEQAARANQAIHLLWVLSRLGGLNDETLKSATSDPDPAVRVHTMRILAERGLLARTNPTGADKDSVSRALATARLQDADALTQRCAAEALGNDPQFENLKPLLALRQRVPAADTHLIYVVRKAIRDQLKADGVLTRLQTEEFSETDERAIASVAVGVTSTEAANSCCGTFSTIQRTRKLSRTTCDIPRATPRKRKWTRWPRSRKTKSRTTWIFN